ncbi:hypothetical protein [Massilia antarctica]|uniref:hypothetical protein n=1 Tax=Massilia antarctica TaxID=2765360 RepID=UPI00226E5748|nr:hypothetical protein [Massilia sp. H27-R4]MCY0910309.1 hypothetical protein [Massilia sp. H27-R4]
MRNDVNTEVNSQPQVSTQSPERGCPADELVDDDLESHRCPECGAPEEFQKRADDSVVWMGLGETENCRCGAEYAHRHEVCKTPLLETSVEILLSLARDVDSVYKNLRLPMTVEQIALNREYFGRIADAITHANHLYIPDRYGASIKERQYSAAFERLLDVIAEVSGGQTARAFIKYFDFPSDVEGLETMITDYQATATKKTSFQVEVMNNS